MSAISTLLFSGCTPTASMRQNHRACATVLVLICTMPFASQATGQSDVLSEAQRSSIVATLPATTCACVHIGDVAAWQTAFGRSRFQKMLDQSTFKPFAAAWRAHTESDAFALEFGLTMSEFELLSTSDLVIAWLPAGPNKLTSAAVASTHEADQHVPALMEKATQRYLRLGYQLQKTTTQVGEVLQFTSGDKKVIIGHHNGRFVVAHDAKVATSLLAGSNDGRLANDAGFQFIAERTHRPQRDQPTSRIRWYCSPWRLLQHTASPPSNLQLLIDQGFGAVDGIGGSIVFDANNILSYQAAAHVKQPLRGAAVSLRTKSVTTQLPDWLSSRVRGVQVIGLDAPSVLTGYGRWFDATEGEGEEGLFDLVLEEIRDEPGAPGVDMRTELIDQVDSPLYVVRPHSTHGEIPVVIAVKAKQTAIVRQAIGRMLQGDPDVRKITIGDLPAWQFGDLTKGGTRQVLGPDLSQVTVCLYGDYVLASAKSESINSLIAETVDANSDTPEVPLTQLNQFMASLEKDMALQPIGYRFAQGADWMSAGYDRIRKGRSVTHAEGTSINMANLAVTLFNQMIVGPAQTAFAKLPPSNLAQKHLGMALDVAHASDQDGWVITGVIRPPTGNDQ